MPANALPSVIAVAAVDPGRTTGVARGIFEPQDTLLETLATGFQVETWQTDGPLRGQAEEIVGELDDWFSMAHMEHSIAICDLHFVIENFILRTAHADLSPVKLTERIEAGWHSDWLPIQRQQPSHAKSFATDARLRAWEQWVVGDHRRDAWRHVLLCVHRILG